jgi:hypothetical protein
VDKQFDVVAPAYLPHTSLFTFGDEFARIFVELQVNSFRSQLTEIPEMTASFIR